MDRKTVHMLALYLAVVGAVNWGLVGFGMLFGGVGANWNLVNLVVGSVPVLESLVYVLVGLSGVYLVANKR